MPPLAKLAVAAGLAGIILATAVVQATRDAHAPGTIDAAVAATDAADSPRPPQHCRTATAPDAQCQAAWEAHRRRFFGNPEH